jgi:hypothetical protein
VTTTNTTQTGPGSKAEGPISLKWGVFWLRILLGFVWVILAYTPNSAAQVGRTSAALWLLPIAIIVGIAPMIWIGLTAFSARKLDERERILRILSTLEGSGFAIIFGCLWWLGSAIDQIVGTDMAPGNPLPIVVLPAIGFLFSTAASQFDRWVELRADTKDRTP